MGIFIIPLIPIYGRKVYGKNLYTLRDGGVVISGKKSRFISHCIPVDDADEVRRIIKETRKAHPQSRHVVWAYIIGDARSVFGMSDDGEPHGTAGKPVLEVLKGCGMTNILVLVIRYFGGIKLGTGGLVSAYTRAAKDVLEKVEPLEKIAKTSFTLFCPYGQYEQIKKTLLSLEGTIEKEEFGTDVTLDFTIPDRQIDICSDLIRDITSGSIILNKEETLNHPSYRV